MATWKIQINPPATPGAPATFDPLQANVGDTVYWSNNTSHPHWPSSTEINLPRQIDPGQLSDAFLLTRPGTIHYSCKLHPDEHGEIYVTESDRFRRKTGIGGFGPV